MEEKCINSDESNRMFEKKTAEVINSRHFPVLGTEPRARLSFKTHRKDRMSSHSAFRVTKANLLIRLQSE
jgi:hypothetical protein